MKTRICHEALHFFYSRQVRSFDRNSRDLETTQRRRLKSILHPLRGAEFWKDLDINRPYEELVQKIPIRSYSDFESSIHIQKQKNEFILSRSTVRYEPTSGSTENRKWIPYTREFLNELNLAAAAWLGDVYQNYPSVKRGRHYWSLSWLPEELRALMSSDDSDLFPFFQRWILKNTMAVSSSLATVVNPKAAWWGTLVQLAAQEDLSLVSVWSPTFWLKVMQDLESQWSLLSKSVQDGKWGLFETELQKHIGPAPQRNIRNLDPKSNEFYQALWPHLELISAWDSSSSQPWFQQLQSKLPHVQFQGKGLWSTEGVVSIPFRGKKILAFESHFFEFRNLRTQEVLPSWKLQKGETYQPILWTSSGLLRYALADQVQVVGFFNQVPCLEFQGRIQSVDLVGEKISADWVRQLIQSHPEWEVLCLVACRLPQPRYILVHQNPIAIDIESELSKLHHYKVAKDLQQLLPALTFQVQNPSEFLALLSKSPVAGQNKIEILLQVENWPEEFSHGLRGNLQSPASC